VLNRVKVLKIKGYILSIYLFVEHVEQVSISFSALLTGSSLDQGIEPNGYSLYLARLTAFTIAVSKSVLGSNLTGVRIPPSPLTSIVLSDQGYSSVHYRAGPPGLLA
jgi:hypothetical protein